MEARTESSNRLASVRELAAAFDQSDFVVWDQAALKDIPSNQEWAKLANPFLVTVRLSAVLMTKEKDELLSLVGDLEERDFDGTPLIEDLVPRMHAAEAFFRDMLKTVEGAETRLLGAACKKAVLEGQPGLDDH